MRIRSLITAIIYLIGMGLIICSLPFQTMYLFTLGLGICLVTAPIEIYYQNKDALRGNNENGN